MENKKYKLISKDLSNLGGRMGTEYTTTNYTKYFSSLEKATHYAEAEYGAEIHWGYRWGYQDGILFSGDLRYVAYYVVPIEIEEYMENKHTVDLEFTIGDKVKHLSSGLVGRVHQIELNRTGNGLYPIYIITVEEQPGVIIRQHGFGLKGVQ